MDDSQKRSGWILEFTRKINVYTTLIVIVAGLLGHSFTLALFVRKRYRVNSCHIYLLCLAVIDGSFLILHFFEDSLRTLIDIYSSDDHSNKTSSSYSLYRLLNYLKILNITDNHDISCRLINYLRYILRFISAYIIVAFTVQRAVHVYSPLSHRFKSKKTAWKTVATISVISLVINVWVLFFFKINYSDAKKYCDVNREFKQNYFRITVAYIFIIMLVPILTIFVGNFIIILKTLKADTSRVTLTNNSNNLTRNRHHTETKTQLSTLNRGSMTPKNADNMSIRTNLLNPNVSSIKSASICSRANFDSNNQIKIYYQARNKLSIKTNNKINSSNAVTKTLLFVSFSYAILIMPYFISWCIFFTENAFKKNQTLERKNYLFSVLQISEIFYVLNYSVYFYINFAFGSVFRSQMKSMMCSKKSQKFQPKIQFYAEEARRKTIKTTEK